ncbi:MAG: hypothetical protein ACOH5I_07670 [Oligoflexus sp.]
MKLSQSSRVRKALQDGFQTALIVVAMDAVLPGRDGSVSRLCLVVSQSLQNWRQRQRARLTQRQQDLLMRSRRQK